MRDVVEWKGRLIVVLGLARSGVAVAKLLHQLGVQVVVNDLKPRSECPEAAELEKLNIPVICGEHPDDLIHDGVDALVKNPGIPYRAKPVQQALAKGIPVWTEVEIASRLSEAPIIGITGSNGKTTTTTLLGKMLTAGELHAVVAGNIGQALTEVVPSLTVNEWLVAELSSFQLKGTEYFHPKVAALLNIVPAHLDYHGTMEDYVASKRRIFQNQTEDDIAVLNADSEACRQIGQTLSSKIWWFSRTQEVFEGVFVRGEWIIARTPGTIRKLEPVTEEILNWYHSSDEVPHGVTIQDNWLVQIDEKPILPVQEVALQGDFNLENALAAIAMALACHCPLSAIQETLRTFHGVEHRLEYVATIDGVRYFNNSKATNAQAAIKSLEAFKEPIVWIAGGLDRGVDFAELVPVLKERVRAVVVYGQTKHILAERAKEAGIDERYLVSDVSEAVQVAHQLAQPGEVVVLAPGCASWDLYTSFEERGSIFKQAVHSLQI